MSQRIVITLKEGVSAIEVLDELFGEPVTFNFLGNTSDPKKLKIESITIERVGNGN